MLPSNLKVDLIRQRSGPSAHRRLTAAVLFGGAMLFICDPASPQAREPQPEGFVIGRRIFFDIGPPFEFYEILSVRSRSEGTLVERIPGFPGRRYLYTARYCAGCDNFGRRECCGLAGWNESMHYS